MVKKVTVIDTSGRTDYPEEALEKIAGLPVDLKSRIPEDDDDFVEKCREAEVILLTAQKITREIIDRLPLCEGIVRYGTGLDQIDCVAAAERGIEVSNVRGFCTNELADHALALFLSLARQITLSTNRVRGGLWRLADRYPAYSLHGKIAGIVGLGDVGKAVAARLNAFGTEVLGCDPYADVSGCGVKIRMGGLDTLLKNSDAVFLHCPLNHDTRHMIGGRELRMMKDTAFIINAARGEVVDEQALITALENREIAGAGLDVLETEPPLPENPLLGMENVLMTPHVGAYSQEAFKTLEIRVFEKVSDIVRRLAGEKQG